MSFRTDKARMLRILDACEAPAEVVKAFEEICIFRTKESGETAEELLASACRKHNFVKPWQDGDEEVFFRPYSLAANHPDRVVDCDSRTPESEQSYRRGFDQGVAYVLQQIAAGKTAGEVKAMAKDVNLWRTQVIQRRGDMPGRLHPQELPERWQQI